MLLSNQVSGLKDSKKLSSDQRTKLSTALYESGASIGIGWVSSIEVDAIGITASVRLAMQRALLNINTAYDQIIIDGNYNFLVDNPQATTLIKADNSVPAVSAASIIAKVARDTYMIELANSYRSYGFERHFGYGTAQHLAALIQYGITPEHRTSFKPIRALLQ